MKKITILLFLPVLLLALAACSGGEIQEEASSTDKEEIQVAGTLKMKIADMDVLVEWENNESVEALKELAKDRSFTIKCPCTAASSRWGTLGPICRETTRRP